MLALSAMYYYVSAKTKVADTIAGFFVFLAIGVAVAVYGEWWHLAIYASWSLLVGAVSSQEYIEGPEDAFSESLIWVALAALVIVLGIPFLIFCLWLLFIDSGRGSELEWQEAAAIVAVFVINLAAGRLGCPSTLFFLEAVCAVVAAYFVWAELEDTQTPTESVA